jgi:hypothetical protein
MVEISGGIRLCFSRGNGADKDLLGDGLCMQTGFALAVLLLLVFSGALLSVRVRGISTTCHCFGPGHRPVSQADLWRTMGLLLSALGGLVGTIWNLQAQTRLDGAGWAVAAPGAAVFVLIWTQLAAPVGLFAGN